MQVCQSLCTVGRGPAHMAVTLPLVVAHLQGQRASGNAPIAQQAFLQHKGPEPALQAEAPHTPAQVCHPGLGGGMTTGLTPEVTPSSLSPKRGPAQISR